MRLRADFWVAAHLRRCEVEGASAYLRRRGAAEAGAIIVKLDCLDGRTALFGIAATEPDREADRRFLRLHKDDWIDAADAEARLRREIGFDPDLWIIEIEDRNGRSFLDMAR